MSAYIPGMGIFGAAEPTPGPVAFRVIPVYTEAGPSGNGLGSYGDERAALRLAESMAAGPVRVLDAQGKEKYWRGEPRAFRYVIVRPVRPEEVEA